MYFFYIYVYTSDFSPWVLICLHPPETNTKQKQSPATTMPQTTPETLTPTIQTQQTW